MTGHRSKYRGIFISYDTHSYISWISS